MSNIKKITTKVMKILNKQGFLKHLDPLQQETLEEDIFELLGEWEKVTKED